ncbi:MAG: manganese efflux pump MntP family protein [Lachnospiraceae bacterium]|nr:manganese efflux pump MntP family protein [Lachnospiraceae bacterium]
MWAEIILTGIGLSMDAFAVAVCKGLGMRRIDKAKAVIIGLYFGTFQAVMPIAGWLLGSRFIRYIESVDHWIAFGLLAFIGIKMIVEAVRESENDTGEIIMDQPLDHREMLLLAVATSIDALAVGISFAAIGTPIFPSAEIIGVITFLLSILGVYVGNRFGRVYEKRACILGGVILTGIGIKILLEHLLLKP